MSEPWEVYAGETRARVADAAMASEAIRRAENPLLVVGPEILDAEDLLDLAVQISRVREIPMVATAHTSSKLVQKGMIPRIMQIVDLTNRIKDGWGVNGREHDLIIFFGTVYNITSQCLSTIKHFAPHIKTMSLCGYYHPNADYSLPTMGRDRLAKTIQEIVERLKSGEQR